ncbi:MAG TPA: hypothetical protein VIZ31_02880, partial [Vicinamibacteria bacterium]
RISVLARDFVALGHDLAAGVARLAGFLEQVAERKPSLLAALDADRAEEGTLASYLLEEIRWGARDLGLPGVPLGLDPVVRGLIPTAVGSGPA